MSVSMSKNGGSPVAGSIPDTIMIPRIDAPPQPVARVGVASRGRTRAIPVAVEGEASVATRGGQGGARYGPPQQTFATVAHWWSAILGVDVTPEQVALCLTAQNIAVLVGNPSDHKSMVDAVGYLICYQRVNEGD